MTRIVGVEVTVAVGTKVSVGISVADGDSVLVGTLVCVAVIVNVGVGVNNARGFPRQSWLIIWQEIPSKMSGRRNSNFFFKGVKWIDPACLFNLRSPISI